MSIHRRLPTLISGFFRNLNGFDWKVMIFPHRVKLKKCVPSLSFYLYDSLWRTVTSHCDLPSDHLPYLYLSEPLPPSDVTSKTINEKKFHVSWSYDVTKSISTHLVMEYKVNATETWYNQTIPFDAGVTTYGRWMSSITACFLFCRT